VPIASRRPRRARRSIVRSVRRTLAFHPRVARVLAVVVALGGALAFTSWASGAEAQRRAWGEAQEVVVVVAPVAVGDAIGAGDVELRSFPAAVVPVGAATTPPLGQIAIADLHPGEILLLARLAPDGTRGAAALVGPGRRAIAVPTGPGAVDVGIGDHVDVLVAFAPTGVDDGDDPALVVAADALVVAVSDDTVTVAVEAFDAPRVAFALANGAVTLALRPPGG
jgi:Flp pilus assembly protein CpaB